jgi:hypothetical protein
VNSSRIALFLIFIGLASAGAGIASWSIMKPTSEWLQNGYASCLWSSTYHVPPEFVPDRSEIGASGSKLIFINPRWDPNHASCGTKGNEVPFDLVDQTKRDIAMITKGFDPGQKVYPVPPFFLMAPFLNSIGVITFVLGGFLAFATSPSPGNLSRPAYNLEKWNGLMQYDADIKRIADALAPFGQKYVDEFAQTFMALNDKIYLPQIVEKILATAKADAAQASIGKIAT